MTATVHSSTRKCHKRRSNDRWRQRVALSLSLSLFLSQRSNQITFPCSSRVAAWRVSRSLGMDGAGVSRDSAHATITDRDDRF